MKKIIISKSKYASGLEFSNQVDLHFVLKEHKEVFIYSEFKKDNNSIVFKKVSNDDFVKNIGQHFRIKNKDFGNWYEIILEGDNDYDEWYNATIENLIPRDRENTELINLVEKLGIHAEGKLNNIIIVEIPKEAFYRIENYNDNERIIWSMSEINEVY